MYLRQRLAMAACATFFVTQNVCWAANVQPQSLSALTPSLDSRPAAGPAISPSHMFKIHAGVTQEYILGPGDVLSITDTSEDKPETTIAPILPDGTAVISYTGVIPAAGRSLREMNELVNEQAKKWYVNPQIIVNLAKQRATTVYLLGELVHPGLYSSGSSEGGMPGGGGARDSNSSASGSDSAEGEGSPSGAAGMGGQSSLTLSGALQMAGGLKETADVRHLRVTRLAPKQTFQIDLWKLMIDGDVTEDIALQPGDVVYVPKGGADYEPSDFGMLVNNRPKVRVLGSVKQPGLLAMAPDDDVLSAIAKAGGFENTAATRYVVLARTNRDGTVTTEKINIKKGYIDGHSSARQKIRPGDVIIVKRSASKTVGVIAGRTLPSVMTGMMMAVLYTRINSNNNN